MKDSRIGETLWSEWSGNDYAKNFPDSVVFYTDEHVNTDNEIVKRALASALQRDGTTDSLGEAFRLLDGSVHISQGYAGYVDGEPELTKCDTNGMTIYEDNAEGVVPITWVEIYVV